MNDNMKEDVLRVLLSEDEIREKVREKSEAKRS